METIGSFPAPKDKAKLPRGRIRSTLVFCDGGRIAGSFYHLVQKLLEVLEAGRGNNDGVTPSADILRDAEKPPARVFLQGKDKRFAFNLHLVGFKRVFIYRRLRG